MGLEGEFEYDAKALEEVQQQRYAQANMAAWKQEDAEAEEKKEWNFTSTAYLFEWLLP